MDLFKNLNEDLRKEDKNAFKGFVIVSSLVVIILSCVVCYKVFSLIWMRLKYNKASAVVLAKETFEKPALNTPNLYRLKLILESEVEVESELKTPAEFQINQVVQVYYNPIDPKQVEYDELLITDIGLFAALFIFLIFLIKGIKDPDSIIPYLQGGN
jgi:hypothetical protein